ncbi:nitrate reductase [Methylovirgula sp. 4M-Z18]|uniref:nitrate reductase n=1 Tax=Methylovirgula sp. 4M-Z18 TaxID=2293567 RepID=UPI000E2EFCD2|nr:nitrate reductase [Methylovirgula sp. 4M-Z18]RFB79861.1 nitrate reductase [Methylovirgula sp. 4M-Z18]
MTAAQVKTTCPYCGVGCGVIAARGADGAVSVKGDPDHPANYGKLCVKGSALAETLSDERRLLYPTIHGVRTTWNRALDAVATGFREALASHGPDSIAVYLSGQLLTEDYYVANKLMKGFLGSANVDTNSRLCMASSVAGHRRAFGADVVPNCYEDLDEADVIVLAGSNAAWCHPILFQRMDAARAKRGTKVITIDPRRTATADSADLHLGIAAGMDAVLFAWLLQEIAARGKVDAAFVAQHTVGSDSALDNARQIAPSLAETAARCGLAPKDVQQFCDWWIDHPKVVTCYSQGINQSAMGTDKVNAILNVHLATGRIGKPGSGPLSLTGQPNAMGGREVGGLANQLAAHMGFSETDVDRVRRFWNAPQMATREGRKAVNLFEAVERGEIRALWILCTNPAVSLPRADAMRAALKRLDFLAVSEASADVDGLLDAAHVVLPAAAWGEKDGTVTNSERRISRQRPFRAPPGEAKPDWWQIAQVARRLGHAEAFAYEKPADIFREHAALSAFENAQQRPFNIGALAQVRDEDYATLAPVQWPVPDESAQGEPRLFAEGGFAHADGKARFVALAQPYLAARTSEAYPFLLNTGRVRDQWHTMTRTGLSTTLAGHIPAPFLDLHPEDAAKLEVADGEFVHVESAHGQAEIRVSVTDAQPRGTAFAPIHWTDATAGRARIGSLVHGFVDPISGQPESKAVPVAIRRVTIAAEGFIVAREHLRLPGWLSHARMSVPGGEAITFASSETPAVLHTYLSNWLKLGASPLMQHNEVVDLHRAASVVDGHLQVLLSVGPKRDEAVLNWAISLLARGQLSPEIRRYILAERAPDAGKSMGRRICACFGVHQEEIEESARKGCSDVEKIGVALKAGTNCGSCRPEIKKILMELRA